MVSRIIRREAEAARRTIISMLRMHQIMEDTQIRCIVTKWQYFEKKITGINRSLAIFCEYIKYQENLLRVVCSKASHKLSVKEKLEKLIVNDIKQLLDLCTNTPAYQGEFDTIILRISFCRMTGDFNMGTKAVDSLIKTHPANPKTWITAGKWFVHLEKPNIGIHVLQQGLKAFNNPIDTDIYEYLVSLEIESAIGKYTSETLTLQQIEERRQQLLVTLNIYMDDFAEREWQDSKFMILILDMLDGYSFCKPIQQRLCKILSEKFGNVGKIWQILVKRDLKESDKDQARLIAKERYQTGLKQLTVNPDECRWLWRQYLDFLIDIVGKTHSISEDENQTLFRKYLIEAFTEAANDQMLTDKYYVKWMEHNVNKECEETILERGLKIYPSSVDLRVVALNQDLWSDSPNTEKTFIDAIAACGDNALLIWTTRLRHMYVKCTTEEIQGMYRRGIDSNKVPPVIVDNLKPRYIEWLGRTVSPDKALQEYGLISEEQPYCKRLHKVALSLLACCNSKSELVPQIHRRLCSQFNKDSEVFFDFVCYYHLLDIKPIEERQKAMDIIYEEARQSLDESAFSALSIQYCDLKDKEMLYFQSNFE